MDTIESLTAERDALKAKNDALTEQAQQLINDLHKHRGGYFTGASGKRNIRRGDYDKMSVAEQMRVGRLASKGEVAIVD